MPDSLPNLQPFSDKKSPGRRQGFFVFQGVTIVSFHSEQLIHCPRSDTVIIWSRFGVDGKG